MELSGQLVRLCIDAACESRESIERWRKQRRTLEQLPSHLADILFQRLLDRRLLVPSLLEIFKHSVETIDLNGCSDVDAEWMAYLGAFKVLLSLNLANCCRITSSALWHLIGMNGLREMDLSRCVKVNDAGVKHLVSITSLEILRISETNVSEHGVVLLSALTNLSVLELGGLPVTDEALNSLQVLKKLEYFDLWGSKISDSGSIVLTNLPKLISLNLAWTSVSTFPNMPSLKVINMSNCKINSILDGNVCEARLNKIILSGATLLNDCETMLRLEGSCLTYLDVSDSSIKHFFFLSLLKSLEYLDLSSSQLDDNSLQFVADIGSNLRHLDLSKTKVTSHGLAILSGTVPKLQYISLSYTSITDLALSYVATMPSLKKVDLSHTNIQGFYIESDDEAKWTSSLVSLRVLCHLETLNLEYTKVREAALPPLVIFQNLVHLALRNPFLTDASLHLLSPISKLRHLSFCDAILTNTGLSNFYPPVTLQTFDLTGCWLLTEDGISCFSRRHPRIDVRHDLLKVQSSERKQVVQYTTLVSPSKNRQTSRLDIKKPSSLSLNPNFVDQRLKYRREEMLALQFSSNCQLAKNKTSL